MVFIGSFFLLIFLFAVKNGQFEDLETPAHKILLDDSIENNSEKNKEDVK